MVACGKSLSGTYTAKGGSGLGAGLVMQKLNFISSDTIELTMTEQTIRTTYNIDRESVLIGIQIWPSCRSS